MKNKKLTLLCSIGLVLVLVLSTILAACAQEAAAPGAPTKISPQVPAQPSTTPTTPSTPAKPAPAPAAEVIKWKMQTICTPTQAVMVEAAIPLCEEVEAMSNGRLIITPYTVGTLCPSADILSSCSAGLVDIAYSSPAYSTGIMPEVGLESAPFTLRSLGEGLEFMHYTNIMDFFKEGYAEKGVNLINMNAYTHVYMLSTKPVNRVSDYKGLKVRAIGARALYLDALGASTVNIPSGEVYTALATGTIDAVVYSAEGDYVSFGWYEIAKYSIFPPLQYICIPNKDVYVNPEQWNSLSPDLQAIVQHATDIDVVRHYRTCYHDNDLGRKTMNEAGDTICNIPEQDYPALTRAAEEVWDTIAEASPRSKQVMKIMTDFMREKGYTDYQID